VGESFTVFAAKPLGGSFRLPAENVQLGRESARHEARAAGEAEGIAAGLAAEPEAFAIAGNMDALRRISHRGCQAIRDEMGTEIVREAVAAFKTARQSREVRTRLENLHGDSLAAEVDGRGQAGQAGPDDDNGSIRGGLYH